MTLSLCFYLVTVLLRLSEPPFLNVMKRREIVTDGVSNKY